jgi:Papain-like cysteine protease AvrRpt2
MGRIVYDIPLVTQAANPICWVACMAMVASERQQTSVGVGNFAGGFDPSNASMTTDITGVDWNLTNRLLANAGFAQASINPKADELESALRLQGPIIFNHFCAGFPYGPGWAPITAPNAAHAIVITGYDSSVNGGQCWMNNPWGNKDRMLPLSAVITAINKWLTATTLVGWQISYWNR